MALTSPNDGTLGTPKRSRVGPPECDCACCEYDAAASARARAGQRPHEPGVEPYTARQLLACRVFRYQVFDSHCGGPEELAWRRRHAPEVMAWLEEEVAQGLDDPEQARFATWLLISVPVNRTPNIDERPDPPPLFTWDGIDAYEILFEHVLHGGGFIAHWSYEFMLPAIRRFAAFLHRRGVIPDELGAALDRDLEALIPKALLATLGCVWWTRDGRMLHNCPKARRRRR